LGRLFTWDGRDRRDGRRTCSGRRFGYGSSPVRTSRGRDPVCVKPAPRNTCCAVETTFFDHSCAGHPILLEGTGRLISRLPIQVVAAQDVTAAEGTKAEIMEKPRGRTLCTRRPGGTEAPDVAIQPGGSSAPGTTGRASLKRRKPGEMWPRARKSRRETSCGSRGLPWDIGNKAKIRCTHHGADEEHEIPIFFPRAFSRTDAGGGDRAQSQACAGGRGRPRKH